MGPLHEIVELPAVNNQGAYTSVCVDVEVQNLVINTILTSSIINDLEGSADAVAFNPAAEDLAEGNGSRSASGFNQAALLVLRDMVKSWWGEACRGNRLADIMVQHLVRWVESPASYLYDRALHYYVQIMSRKAFQQLLTDFRRVGSNVIFASPTRLMLQTSKQEVGNAYAYSQYILRSIQQKPLFHFLGLEIKDYWDVLVWYDLYNYGGKGTQSVDENTDSAKLETVMHWQLSSFLPVPLQSVFDDWIIEFIELMHQLKRPAIWSHSYSALNEQQARTFLSVTEDPTSTEITTVLQDDFSKPLKKQITSLIRRQREELLHPELASDWSFPVLAGGSLNQEGVRQSRDPVLELVKALMQVVSLHKPLQLETRLLRKELLSLFDVREFGAEARFENSGSSLKFENLVCDACTAIRDLDLCRDEDIIPEIGGDGQILFKAWRCQNCNNEYDQISLEEHLIARVQAKLLDWHTQDLKCKKCGALQGDSGALREHCTCGGHWQGSSSKTRLLDLVAVMQRVSDAYGLKMLRHVIGSAQVMM